MCQVNTKCIIDWLVIMNDLLLESVLENHKPLVISLYVLKDQYGLMNHQIYKIKFMQHE